MRTLLLTAAMVSFTVIANLMLKTGAVAWRDAGGEGWVQVLNWRIAAGCGSFGAALVLYTILLRSVPLNVAQSFTAAQFILTVLASAAVLGEPITAARWIGIAMIAGGIAVVGWSQG